MHPGKSVLARALVSRGGNPQRGTDFMLNETDDSSLVETDSSGLFRTDDTGYAHVPLKLKDGIDHPVAMLPGERLLGATAMPEDTFTSLNSISSPGERETVMRKLTPQAQEWAESYWQKMDEDKSREPQS